LGQPDFGADAFGLLFLASPALPAGAFAFSQGLESAVAEGIVASSKDLENYLADLLAGSLSTFDLPLLFRAFKAALLGDASDLAAASQIALAGRETRELYMAEKEMGRALGRLAKSLYPDKMEKIGNLGFVGAFGLLAALAFPTLTQRGVGLAYAYGFLENQLAAATRLFPIGQTEARKILLALRPSLAEALDLAEILKKDEIGSNLLGLSIVSSWHEAAPSRLFRS
jgi:urease accessory protein